jgi:S-adenosylmethionine hydrolase
VFASIAPQARVVHITHTVPPQNIALGALIVAASAPLLPPGGVLLGVVDPGVGTDRRGLIVRAAGRWLVGPDNGLLLAGPAPTGVWVLDRPEHWRPDPTPTFHGRDVFAPVAAQLANYVRPDALGSAIHDPVAAPRLVAEVHEGTARGEVIYIDRFGNLITNLPLSVAQPESDVVIEIAGRRIAGIRRSYGEGREPIALVGSWNLLEIAVPGGSAAELLGVARGTEVLVRHRAT